MEETRTGANKEFVFSVIWFILILMIGRGLTNSIQNYKIIGVAATIRMCCILGFFVMTRYCAIYTYSLKNDRLRVSRKIGHRVKSVDMAISSVKSISRQKSGGKVKKIYNMRKTVISSKDVYYLTYEKNNETNMLVFEPSAAMADKIKSRMKNIKKSQ